MIAYDFSYNGILLSDFGFMIGEIDNSSSSEVVSAGSKITFSIVHRHKGKKYGLTSTQYNECIQTTFTIVKNPCCYKDLKITNDEYRDLMRWLNRREFLEFQIFDEDENDRDACFYEASFNIEKRLVGGMLYGLDLTMETNKPFGYGEEQVITWDISDTSKKYILTDISDEIGYIYPDMIITCKSDGDLEITNETEGITMSIDGCSYGETITVYGDTQIISSTKDAHCLYDDFNFEFFRIGNTFENRENIISTTLPCSLTIKYSPIIKDTPD